ncbi:hypothetical protein H9W95_10155 [Flavobacterium lindanitolerans]|nr:hypothetical protein [Flavobacterium lindanitolerans]
MKKLMMLAALVLGTSAMVNAQQKAPAKAEVKVEAKATNKEMKKAEAKTKKAEVAKVKKKKRLRRKPKTLCLVCNKRARKAPDIRSFFIFNSDCFYRLLQLLPAESFHIRHLRPDNAMIGKGLLLF